MPESPDNDSGKRPEPEDDLGVVVERRDGGDAVSTKGR